MNVRRPRVAVTGIGMVTGLGCDAESTLRRLIAGDVAVAPIGSTLHRCGRPPYVAEIPSSVGSSEGLTSRSDAFAAMAAREALMHAGLMGSCVELTLGASTASTAEGIAEAEATCDQAISPLVARMVSEPIGASGHALATALGNVANATVVCSACSSGALAIAIGAMRLEQGGARPQLVGGTDSLNLLTLSGFEALGALSERPCRPFDEHRSGLNLGEGSAFLVLESEAMAKARGASVLAWLDGYAVGAEAHHLTHPEPDGQRAAALIRRAMDHAAVDAADVGYVNAHGTATLANDEMESKALRLALGAAVERTYVSSSKGQLGHTLAAAGAIEAAITVGALLSQAAPPTQGLSEPAQACPLRHVIGRAIATEIRAAISNSFGFGGACAVLAFKRHDQKWGATNAQPAEFVPSGGPCAVNAPVWVTGVVTLGSLGILRGVENLAWFDQTGDSVGTLPFEPLDRLIMERSRRFDRATALTALGCSQALDESGLDVQIPAESEAAQRASVSSDASDKGVGMVLGNALGAVGRSAAFVQRILKRGAKGANPAEFPHLLPSAVSGNASIYAGLRGPVFNVSDIGASVQQALELGITCVRGNLARAMLVGTTECRDEVIVEAIRSDLASLAYPRDVEDTSAWLVVEPAVDALARHARGCELWTGWVEASATSSDEGRSAIAPDQRSLVLWCAQRDAGASRILDDLGWSGAPLKTYVRRGKGSWAEPGVALAAAAALVLADKCSSALVITDAPRGLHWALFRQPSPATGDRRS